MSRISDYEPEELLALARRYRVGFLAKPEVEIERGRRQATAKDEAAVAYGPVRQQGLRAGPVEREAVGLPRV